MSREEIIQIITENIYPNGNNEITANVLNPVLDAMVNQINDITGNLDDLASIDTSSLVNAINSVITQFEGIDSNSVKLRSGIDNPNVTPPDEYNTADFYIQEDTEGNPLELWQFNGIEWTKQNSQPDGFTQLGTLSKTGNTINVGIGYAWIINDILESNTFAQEFIIENESTGQSRVDIIVTDGNQFALIQGDSSAGEGSAAQPQIPVGSLLLTSINIYEDNISEIIDPYIGSPYVTKISQSFIDYTANNADNGIAFDGINGRSKFALTSATPYVVPAYVLDNSNLSTVSLATDMPVVFYNLGAGHIYKHNDTSIPFGMPFIFPDGQDFTAIQGSVISFLPRNGQLIFDNYSISSSSPFLNVKDYGAIGDGITNDRIAVQNAINDAVLGKGEVVFPAGEYNCTGGLEVNGAIKITGLGGNYCYTTVGDYNDGFGSVIFTTSSTENLMEINEIGFIMRDISIVNRSEDLPTAGVGVRFYQAGNFELSNVNIHRFWNNMHVEEGVNWKCDHVIFSEPVSLGVKIENPVTIDEGDWSFTSCEFLTRSNTASCLYATGSGGMKFVNTKFHPTLGNATRFKNGIELLITDIGTAQLMVANCSFEGFQGAGIKVNTEGGESDFFHVILTGNQFAPLSQNLTDSCVIIENVDGVSIVGNSFGTDTFNVKPSIQIISCNTGVIYPNYYYGVDTGNEYEISGSTDILTEPKNMAQIIGNNNFDGNNNFYGSTNFYEGYTVFQSGIITTAGTPSYLEDVNVSDATEPTHPVTLRQVQTEIATVSDLTVALVVPNLYKYYALTGLSAIASLPPIAGNVGKTLIVTNKTTSNQTIYSNDGVTPDIWSIGGGSVLAHDFKGSITLFNDGAHWVITN